MSTGTELSQQTAQTNSHNGHRKRGALFASVHGLITSRFSILSGLRADLTNERPLKLIPSMKATWQSSVQSPWRLWFGGSMVWRDPGFDELYLNGPSIIPNPNLKAEEGYWCELGVSKSWRTSFQGLRLLSKSELKGFYQEYDQLISYLPLDPYRVQADNVDGARLYGLETSAQLMLRAHTHSFKVEGSGSVIKHRTLAQPIAPLPLRPQQYGTLEVSWYKQLPTGQLSAWSGVRGRGKITTDRFGERTLPTRMIYHMGLTRAIPLAPSTATSQLLNTWRISARIDNLTNVSSYDFALLPLPGRTFSLILELE